MSQEEASNDPENTPPTLLIGPRLVLPDTATGPAIEHGCGMFFENHLGNYLAELSAQECCELVAWMTGNHPNICKPDNASLN